MVRITPRQTNKTWKQKTVGVSPQKVSQGNIRGYSRGKYKPPTPQSRHGPVTKKRLIQAFLLHLSQSWLERWRSAYVGASFDFGCALIISETTMRVEIRVKIVELSAKGFSWLPPKFLVWPAFYSMPIALTWPRYCSITPAMWPSSSLWEDFIAIGPKTLKKRKTKRRIEKPH